MIESATVLALVTARGGSKGMPGKNVRAMGGKPLIHWTIDAAKRARYVDRVVVSTDDDAIARAALEAGAEVPFRRPDELASDAAASIDVVLHGLSVLPGYDWVVLLQPTSPLRTAEDIDGTLELCVRSGAPAGVSVTEVDQSPYWMYCLRNDGTLRPVIPDAPRASRRQDLPAAYTLNGAVYAARTGWLAKARSFVTEQTVAYLMPRERSIDIDTESDFTLAEKLVGASENE